MKSHASKMPELVLSVCILKSAGTTDFRSHGAERSRNLDYLWKTKSLQGTFRNPINKTSIRHDTEWVTCPLFRFAKYQAKVISFSQIMPPLGCTRRLLLAPLQWCLPLQLAK